MDSDDIYKTAPGPVSAREAEARGLGSQKTTLTAGRLKAFFDHQRWLASNGDAGKQLRLEQSFCAYKKDFEQVVLDGADLSRAEFKNVMFVLCSLKRTRFAGSKLERVEFLGCDLTGADFRGIEIHSVSFEESNVQQALFDADVRCSLDRSGILSIHSNKPANSPII